MFGGCFVFFLFNLSTIYSFTARPQQNRQISSNGSGLSPKVRERAFSSIINTAKLRINMFERPTVLSLQGASLPSSLEDLKNILMKFVSEKSDSSQTPSDNEKAVRNFYDALNDGAVGEAMLLISDDCVYDNTKFYEAFNGKVEIRKHFARMARAYPLSKVVLDAMALGSQGRVGVKWHVEDESEDDSYSRGCSFYTIDSESNLITSGFIVQEPPLPKPGDAGLNLLSQASKIIEIFPKDETLEVDSTINEVITEKNGEAVQQYFNSWNARDLESAVSCFTEDCEYDDSQFDEPFKGSDAMSAHLNRVVDALPETFQFVVDDAAVGNDGNVCACWHVESNNEILPFTRGCSFYKVDSASNKIAFGFDVPEPAVIKSGNLVTGFRSQKNMIKNEPIRVIPLICWIAYIYVVFFSNGILPGADALQLEQRTWEEVRDLSINFFFVSPLLHLPFSPTVHPMLESIFNLLLSWAAMFAGFLSDDRDDKANELPTLPIVIGMQFLTSAFLLPYLFSRTSEPTEPSNNMVYSDDLTRVQNIVGESRLLGPAMSVVGATSIAWAFLARSDEFGSGWDERYSSLIDLLSVDRVGSSFVVDLAIFAIFQGWLVDDDMRRRGVDVDTNEMALLRGIAKFLPFFGLAIYLTARPQLPVRPSDSL